MLRKAVDCSVMETKGKGVVRQHWCCGYWRTKVGMETAAEEWSALKWVGRECTGSKGLLWFDQERSGAD